MRAARWTGSDIVRFFAKNNQNIRSSFVRVEWSAVWDLPILFEPNRRHMAGSVFVVAQRLRVDTICRKRKVRSMCRIDSTGDGSGPVGKCDVWKRKK